MRPQALRAVQEPYMSDRMFRLVELAFGPLSWHEFTYMSELDEHTGMLAEMGALFNKYSIPAPDGAVWTVFDVRAALADHGSYPVRA